MNNEKLEQGKQHLALGNWYIEKANELIILGKTEIAKAELIQKELYPPTNK